MESCMAYVVATQHRSRCAVSSHGRSPNFLQITSRRIAEQWCDDVETAMTSLVIRSKSGREYVAVKISFVSSPRRSLERTVITLHEKLSNTPTWHANCQGVRPAQIARGRPKRLCWRKKCSTPITQQAERSWLRTRRKRNDVPVNFSWKLTKDKTC
jgi:hypothetical protein